MVYFRVILGMLLLGASASVSLAADWRTFTSTSGKTFVGSVIEVDSVIEQATVVVKATGKNTTLDFSVLSAGDVEFLRNWTPGSTSGTSSNGSSDEAEVSEADLGPASPRLYPRTKQEIKSNLAAISKRKPPSGIDKAQQETINVLNAFRYVSGVEPNAVATPQKVDEARQAAEACQKHGGLSHDLGSFTNKSNLHSGGTMLSSVGGYISDNGENNREKRGHRRWCLNPRMVKTGFGEAGRYSAMWSLDNSGKASKDSWSYPGAGYFPKEYLLGNAWSFYSTSAVPEADDLKVEVFKLFRRPEKKFGITADIPGKIVSVPYVHTYANVINFEPDRELVSGRGVFWVRIRGGGMREGYLVELY